MAVSQFALKWDSYEENMKTFIGEINRQNEFTDVTLVTGDGQQMDLHRMVLSAFSPVLRTMFGQKSSPNTLLFLRGVSSKCLGAIRDFMYLGEVNILEEDLPEFLAVAKDLQMKGLTHEEALGAAGVPKKKEAKELNRNRQNFDNIDDLDQILQNLETNETIEEETKHHITAEEEVSSVIAEISNEKPMEINNGSISPQGLEEMLSNSMVKIEGGYSCTNCDKQTFGSKNGRSHMKRHIESKHITGLEFNCHNCGQKFSSRNNLSRHVSRVHRM